MYKYGHKTPRQHNTESVRIICIIVMQHLSRCQNKSLAHMGNLGNFKYFKKSKVNPEEGLLSSTCCWFM